MKDWSWWLRPGNEKHRCTATTNKGSQCSGQARIKGLCRKHDTTGASWNTAGEAIRRLGNDGFQERVRGKLPTELHDAVKRVLAAAEKVLLEEETGLNDDEPPGTE